MCTVDEIAAVLNCSRDVIFDRFSDAIKKGRENGRASLRRHQYAAAQKGNPTMLIWLGKQYLGQKDVIEVADANVAQRHAEVIRLRREERMNRERSERLRAAGVDALVAVNAGTRK